jgi:peptidoglycan/LPS O-acetylase OafA/YrhL
MMAPSLPQKYVPYAYGILQAALTTAVATAIAIFPLAHSALEFFERWALAWGIAWVTMLPVVVLASPLIQRACQRFCQPEQRLDRQGR